MSDNGRRNFALEHKTEPLKDRFGRVALKLRISVTDRCNFRCHFCMPLNPVWLPKPEILTYEEIARVARILAQMGVTKIRLSGGEPLMRRDLDKLVTMLRQIPEIKTVTVTTNGFYLPEMAERLKRAGLDSVTVSLHSLKPERYEEITGRKEVFERVVDGLKTAQEVGLNPVKVNVVIVRGCNDDEILDFAKLARETGLIVRFIEYMPFDGRKLWNPELLVPGDEILRTIETLYALVPLPRKHGSTAQEYCFADGIGGEIGVITSMTSPFCSDCDRIRLTSDGKIIPCMFSKDEYDVKSLLRSGASDGEIASFIRQAFWKKFAGVESLLEGQKIIVHVRPMYEFGG
ncbi:MAG: GTP 3',8-cyclase MoaA [Candidatus Fervidibacter sp.]|uniref:GTP 3',8-cyclase MoaA n=1 Tax=Candidatus Fervidibacter sp. TaxID=3100871 RepID=UPI004049F9FC